MMSSKAPGGKPLFPIATASSPVGLLEAAGVEIVGFKPAESQASTCHGWEFALPRPGHRQPNG